MNKTYKSVFVAEFQSKKYLYYKRLDDLVIKAKGGNREATLEIMAFAFHPELKSVIIPQSVTSIGTYTFAMCQSLTDVVLSEGITSIGEGAFYNCTSLKHVTIPSSVTSIGNGAFTDEKGDLSITVYGTADSYAETWAKNNGYTFIAQ